MARPGKVSPSRRGRTPADEKRPVRWRRYQFLFLVVCEDQTTEPHYFNTFLAALPEEVIFLRAVGTGRDPLGVVEQAQREREKLQAEAGREVDETWLVFDKDDADDGTKKTERFEEAETLAEQQHFRLAFSNEVFELWLLLHLREVTADLTLPRAEIYRRLGEALRQHSEFADFEYNHQNTPAADIVAAIARIGSEELAIARATALLAAHGDKSLLASNPSTRVHLLVQSLRAWIVYFSD